MIDTHMHYQDAVIEQQEMDKSAFPQGLLLTMQNTEKPVQIVWDYWGAWQNVSRASPGH